jgi:hypothetical protein
MKSPDTEIHEKGEGKYKHTFSTTKLGKGQLFTDGISNAKTLVISAHGNYGRKSGDVKIPEDTRFEFLNPHGTYLADPRIGNIASGERKIYATVGPDGVHPETEEAKKLLDEKGPKALTGSHKQGMVRNYALSPYEDDSDDVVGQTIHSNRFFAGTNGTKADFLTLKKDTSLEEVLAELKAKGIHYDNIDLGFCRGSDSLFKRGHTFDPKNATRLASGLSEGKVKHATPGALIEEVTPDSPVAGSAKNNERIDEELRSLKEQYQQHRLTQDSPAVGSSSGVASRKQEAKGQDSSSKSPNASAFTGNSQRTSYFDQKKARRKAADLELAQAVESMAFAEKAVRDRREKKTADAAQVERDRARVQATYNRTAQNPQRMQSGLLQSDFQSGSIAAAGPGPSRSAAGGQGTPLQIGWDSSGRQPGPGVSGSATSSSAPELNQHQKRFLSMRSFEQAKQYRNEKALELHPDRSRAQGNDEETTRANEEEIKLLNDAFNEATKKRLRPRP